MSLPTGSYAITGDYSKLFRVSFDDPGLGSDVDAITVVTAYNLLTGSDVAISIYSDGNDAVQFSDSTGVIDPDCCTDMLLRARE